MAKIKQKISKTEFEALADSLKDIYVADAAGDYVLDAEGVEDVTGLKNKIAELLKDGKTKGDILKTFEGLDPEAARKALKAMDDIETKKLEAKGEYDKLAEKQKNEYDTRITGITEAHNKTLAGLKREKLTNFLVQNGVLPDRAKYALADVESLIDLAEGEGGFELKGKDGAELASVVSTLKTGSAFLFAASGASGSGASGSDGKGGESKQMSRAAFAELSPQQQSEFSVGGGTLTD